MKKLPHWRRFLLVATACALAACGDGSNTSSGSLDGEPNPPGTSNSPPTISGSPISSASVGQAYSFQPSASDADGNALTFSIANKPAWAAFDASTGRLSGTPSSTQVGAYSGITISVSDGTASASLPGFTVTVQSGNRAPVISGTPSAVASVGQAYSFQPTASDADGNTLTFSVTNLPSWTSFNQSTGRISGTPSSSLAGLTFSGIVISVSDGTVSASLPAFSIVVVAPNGAPRISGTPATSVVAGQAYTFQPTASDPENQTLTFRITGSPPWATFNSTTGRLSGTPTSANVGSYTNIVISVTDGTTTVPLPTFSIAVTAASTAGSATLRWTPPTLNEDGTPIENLAGYRVYYGTSTGNLNQVLTIASPSVTSAVIQSLTPATWYFALKAYNAANVESSFSNIASKTIY